MPDSASQNTLNTNDPSSKVILPYLVRLVILIAMDASAIWYLNKLLSLGYYPLAAASLIILIFVNVVLLRQEAYPLRWMLVGLVLMAMFTIYPIIFTVWVSFTNYGEGHLITKEQAIDQILKAKYLPETGQAFTWTAFKSPEDTYALWLRDADGNGHLAKVGEPLTQPQPGESGIGELDDKGIPETIEGFQRLNAIVAATDQNITEIQFGEQGKTVQVRSPSEAAELLPLYIYDPDLDTMTSQETGIVYHNIRGTYSSPDGEQLRPGFIARIGLANFKEFFTSPALRGPLVRIIIWNFAFVFSVCC